MFSFLSKLFSGKPSHHTCVVVHDDVLEVARFSGNFNNPHLESIGRFNLSPGIVRNGQILRESDFHNAVKSLFNSNPSSFTYPGRLIVNIPFQQVYAFAKSFSAHSSDDHIKSTFFEIIQNELPFEIQEMEIDYTRRLMKGSLYCGAVAYSKTWKHILYSAFADYGFSDSLFVAEPVALSQLKPIGDESDTLMLKRQPDSLALSLFLKGLLYDSFVVKGALVDGKINEKALLNEVQTEIKAFNSLFNWHPEQMYLLGFSSEERDLLESSEFIRVAEPHFLNGSDSPLSRLIDPSVYSLCLIGLVTVALNTDAEADRMIIVK